MESPTYLDLLEKTEGEAVEAPSADSEPVDRFRTFFENMTPEQVRETVDTVYAKDAWLNDTLILHHGIEEIRPYFIKTAQRAAAVRVEVLDVLRSGKDIYLKWVMDIDWSAFKKGKTTRSFGMSNLRFNARGEVILHYDFWDSASGFFEHLPLVGALIRGIKRRVAK